MTKERALLEIQEGLEWMKFYTQCATRDNIRYDGEWRMDWHEGMSRITDELQRLKKIAFPEDFENDPPHPKS